MKVNFVRTIVCVWLLLCCRLAICEGVENLEPADGYAGIAEQLASIIRVQLDEKLIPAFSLALVDDQRIVWAQGFGYADTLQNELR